MAIAWGRGILDKAAGFVQGRDTSIDPAIVERDAVFNYKKEALETARQTAIAAGRQPTMTDYYIAAEQLGQAKAQEMQALGIQWGPATYSDLSAKSAPQPGMSPQQVQGLSLKLDGFLVRRDDIEPNPDLLKAASLQAQRDARAEGRKPTRMDSLRALQQFQNDPSQAKAALGSLESMKNELDLDGDHVIGPLYETIGNQANFQGTAFEACTFHPAGTLMEYHAEGASFKDCTFDGMSGDDHVTMKSGTYENVRFTNIKDGTLEIADNAQINGLDIRGAHAKLEIGRASVSGLDAREARILSLSMKEGATVSNARFEGATIVATKGDLQKTKWQNVEFKNSNLPDLDLRNSELINVNFKDANLQGLDLRGARLTNVHFTASQMKDMKLDGAIFDNVTVNGVAMNSPNDKNLILALNQIQGSVKTVVDVAQQFGRDAGMPAPTKSERVLGTMPPAAASFTQIIRGDESNQPSPKAPGINLSGVKIAFGDQATAAALAQNQAPKAPPVAAPVVAAPAIAAPAAPAPATPAPPKKNDRFNEASVNIATAPAVPVQSVAPTRITGGQSVTLAGIEREGGGAVVREMAAKDGPGKATELSPQAQMALQQARGGTGKS